MDRFAFNSKGIMLIFICGAFTSLSWVGLCLDTYIHKDFKNSNVMKTNFSLSITMNSVVVWNSGKKII